MNARRRLVAALGGLLVLLAAPCAAVRRKGASGLSGRLIGSITIETYNVFNTNVYPESKVVYRMANALHRTTREGVVRRELLFDVGQRYDANLIRETERSLRLLPYIRHAAADAVINSSGTVDVTVRTYDAWSLEIIANFKRAGGASEWKAGLTEHNLLGRGTTLSAAYNQNGREPSKSAVWRDTQFLGRPHLLFSATADAGPGSRRFALALDHPFYASITRAASGLTADYRETNAAVYGGEVQLGAALRRSSEIGANYGIALATSTERTRRVRFGLMNHHVDFLATPATAPGTLPAREQYIFAQLAVDWEELDFVTERRMQKFTHDEDYNLGLGVFPSLAWAPAARALGSSQSQALPGVLIRKGFDWVDRLLLLRASYATTFINGANADRVAGGDALFFIAGLPRQTVAMHAAYDHGWRIDPSARLALGESNGLRGYGLSQFSGERRLLLNLEDRVFLVDEWLRLLDVGAVVFFDSGFAWGPGSTTRLADLRHSAGVGLRLAPSRSASNSPVRIDLARAFSPNGTHSRWALSILAGHAFGPE